MRLMAYVSNAESTPVFKLPEPIADPTSATVAPVRMDQHEKSRVSAASHRARRLFPGVVGEVLYRELDAYAQWAYRLYQSGLMPRLVDHIMTAAEDKP